MRRVAALVLPLLLLAPGAATPSGCAPPGCGAQSTLVRSVGLLDYRPGGPRGPLLAYGLARGKVRFRLPPGMLSADGRTFFAPAAASARTRISRYDARTGRLGAAFRVPGTWSVAAVSANGRRVVLRKPGSHTMLRVDGRAITLPGEWGVEAVSNDGRRLFLLQYLRDGYKVRWYDLAAGQLMPGSLRDKTEPALMDGVASAQLATPDGHRLLTLFLTRDGEAAVHILDLRNPHAVCVDLPGEHDVRLASQYALALAPDARTLIAVNAALGAATTIDVVRSRITRSAAFRRVAEPTGLTVAAVSDDGRTVAFAAGPHVWTYDVHANAVRTRGETGRTVVAVAFRPDGRSILLVRADRTSRMLLARP